MYVYFTLSTSTTSVTTITIQNNNKTCGIYPFDLFRRRQQQLLPKICRSSCERRWKKKENRSSEHKARIYSQKHVTIINTPNPYARWFIFASSSCVLIHFAAYRYFLLYSTSFSSFAYSCEIFPHTTSYIEWVNWSQSHIHIKCQFTKLEIKNEHTKSVLRTDFHVQIDGARAFRKRAREKGRERKRGKARVRERERVKNHKREKVKEWQRWKDTHVHQKGKDNISTKYIHKISVVTRFSTTSHATKRPKKTVTHCNALIFSLCTWFWPLSLWKCWSFICEPLDFLLVGIAYENTLYTLAGLRLGQIANRKSHISIVNNTQPVESRCD